MNIFNLVLMGVMFVLGTTIISLVAHDVWIGKKEGKRREEEKLKNLELVKQNKKINNLEFLISQYPQYDKIDKKLTKLSNKIEDLQEEMDGKEIKDYEWIRIINEKLSILENTVLKYMSLREEEQEEVKPMVLKMIKKIKKEVKEKEQIVTNNRVGKEKERFEQRVKELDEVQ